MGRGRKTVIAVAVVLIALLAINTLVVDGDTESAGVTVPGGHILDLPAGEIQAIDEGPRSGSPIVLIHCFTCAIDWWDGMLPALVGRHRVVAIDLLGHGGSEKPGSGYTVPQSTYQAPSGQYCREYQTTIVVNGRPESAHGTACREPDGSWRVAS